MVEFYPLKHKRLDDLVKGLSSFVCMFICFPPLDQHFYGFELVAASSDLVSYDFAFLVPHSR